MKKFLKLIFISIAILFGIYIGYKAGRYAIKTMRSINELIIIKDCYEWQKLEREHKNFELGEELVKMCEELNIKIK